VGIPEIWAQISGMSTTLEILTPTNLGSVFWNMHLLHPKKGPTLQGPVPVHNCPVMNRSRAGSGL